MFDSLIELTPPRKFDVSAKTIFCINSQGVGTSRDAWCYNYSKNALAHNMERTNSFYNEQVDEHIKASSDKTYLSVTEFLNTDETKISWSSSLIPKLEKHEKAKFESDKIVTALFRPFIKSYLYAQKEPHSMLNSKH